MNAQQQSRETAVGDDRRPPAAAASSQKGSAESSSAQPIASTGQQAYAGQQRVDQEKVMEVETAILNFVADSVAEDERRS